MVAWRGNLSLSSSSAMMLGIDAFSQGHGVITIRYNK